MLCPASVTLLPLLLAAGAAAVVSVVSSHGKLPADGLCEWASAFATAAAAAICVRAFINMCAGLSVTECST
jgi:hypothetical protein